MPRGATDILLGLCPKSRSIFTKKKDNLSKILYAIKIQYLFLLNLYSSNKFIFSKIDLSCVHKVFQLNVE